jgi:carboxymethylenebutenolidase
MAADQAVVETDGVIKMTDGNCDAALFHPSGNGNWPGAVIFTNALGLRPAFRDMGRRLAAEGYTVLGPAAEQTNHAGPNKARIESRIF